MDTERALIAHVLRRTTFGPFPGQVDRLVGKGVAAAIDAVLAAPALSPGRPSFNESNDDPPRRWLTLMADPTAGIHEKLTWFWHSHLTTSYDKVGSWRMMFQQHRLLRHHAVGNFRELLQSITVDPAMLVYLDGDGSSPDGPNENYGREVMELFALGRGNYTQADVRAAARALAGWSVDYDHAKASFDQRAVPTEPVDLFGQPVSTATEVIDTICHRPACAARIVGALHRFLTGADPSAPRRADLIDLFASTGLEIGPLVEAIVRHPSFLDLRVNRPRYPVEWVTAAVACWKPDSKGIAYDTCSNLGQLPYYPPNVAGWPAGPRWLAPSYLIARAAFAVQARPVADIRDATDPVAAALAHCSVYEPSATTVEALRQLAASLTASASHDRDGAAATLLAATVASPDFALA